MRWVAWPHNWIYCHVSSIPWPRWHACWKWAARWSCKPYRSGGPGGWRSKKYEKDMETNWEPEVEKKTKRVLKLCTIAGGCVYVLFKKHSCSSTWIRQDSSRLAAGNFVFTGSQQSNLQRSHHQAMVHRMGQQMATTEPGPLSKVLLKSRTPDEPNEMLPDKSIQILLLSCVIVCLGLYIDLLSNEQPGGAFLEPAC